MYNPEIEVIHTSNLLHKLAIPSLPASYILFPLNNNLWNQWTQHMKIKMIYRSYTCLKKLLEIYVMYRCGL